MLLRSSSNPVSHSPNRDTVNTVTNCTKHLQLHDHCTTKHSLIHIGHHLNLTSFSCNSSPRSHSDFNFYESSQQTSFRHKDFRRARSDSNLEGLTCRSCDLDEFHCLNTTKRSSKKDSMSMLQTAPSLSIYNTSDGCDDNDKNPKDVPEEEVLVRTVTIGESIKGIGGGEFSIGKKTMGLIEEEAEGDEGFTIQNLSVEEVERASPPICLATGLGLDDAGFALGDCGHDTIDLNLVNFDEGGHVEEYYKRMVDEFPCHPLLLRNYAQLLQSKGDLHGAEDYYYRAAQADPDDGKILMRYAKLVWELHQDLDRALSYYERAAEAAPRNSEVLAAYASFLWAIEDEEEDDRTRQDHIQVKVGEGQNDLDNLVPKEKNETVMPLSNLAAGLEIDAAGFAGNNYSNSDDIEEYYRRVLEENPSNPLLLRNYAHFLCQSKGDLQGVEQLYSRAILADPGDGEIMSRYAEVVWKLHHDLDKALCYFKRAVEASPEDSHVLAAYASFLWEIDDNNDNEEDIATQYRIQVPLVQEGVTKANA